MAPATHEHLRAHADDEDCCQIRIELRDGVLVLAPAGDFDEVLGRSPAANAAVLAAAEHGGDIALDLSRVTFMDSRGIAWLVRVRNAAHARPGRTVTITAASPRAARVLQLTGLTRAFGFTTCS